MEHVIVGEVLEFFYWRMLTISYVAYFIDTHAITLREYEQSSIGLDRSSSTELKFFHLDTKTLLAIILVHNKNWSIQIAWIRISKPDLAKISLLNLISFYYAARGISHLNTRNSSVEFVFPGEQLKNLLEKRIYFHFNRSLAEVYDYKSFVRFLLRLFKLVLQLHLPVWLHHILHFVGTFLNSKKGNFAELQRVRLINLSIDDVVRNGANEDSVGVWVRDTIISEDFGSLCMSTRSHMEE